MERANPSGEVGRSSKRRKYICVAISNLAIKDIPRARTENLLTLHRVGRSALRTCSRMSRRTSTGIEDMMVNSVKPPCSHVRNRQWLQNLKNFLSSRPWFRSESWQSTSRQTLIFIELFTTNAYNQSSPYTRSGHRRRHRPCRESRHPFVHIAPAICREKFITRADKCTKDVASLLHTSVRAVVTYITAVTLDVLSEADLNDGMCG
jgi:hypothetical protein